MTGVTWHTDTVFDLVTWPAVSIDHRASLTTVIGTMGQLGVGLLVVTENNVVVGVVSERDVVWALSRGANSDDVWAADIMTPDPTTVSASSTTAEAARAMAVGSHRHIVVTAPDGVGVLSASDLLADVVTGLEKAAAR